MAVQGVCGYRSAYPSTLILVFVTGFRYFSYHVATQSSSRSWVHPVPDPMLPEKLLGYSRESNQGPLGWLSEVLNHYTNQVVHLRLGLLVSGFPTKTLYAFLDGSIPATRSAHLSRLDLRFLIMLGEE